MYGWLITLLSLMTLTIAGCYLEAGGCSDNVCFSASDHNCDDNCNEELYCEDAVNIRQRMAEIITDARNHSRNCGATSYYPAANEIFWNDKLASAAQTHSTDMARHNFLSHTGSDGSTPDQRTTDAGYNFRRVAENIAGGQETATTVVTAWLDSVEHCANIMNPAIQEIGAACVLDERSDFKTYWTLVLASPQTSQ